MLRTLRQPRYAALSVVMGLIALACIAAGTWQVARFQQKVHENDALRNNAHRAAVPVADLLPLVGSGHAPGSYAIDYRTVTATGRYDAVGQTLVRARAVGDSVGFLVLTPFTTTHGTLLVVRGFLAQPASGVPTPKPPPSGVVTIAARTHPPETRNDAAAHLGAHQVESINPAEQAARLGGAFYNGYGELKAGQPGSAGLTAMPSPDLSNPAGGALEPQHFAYVIQWYLFAVLALAAPFAMARAETKVRRGGEIDAAPAEPGAAPEPAQSDEPKQARPSADQLRAAKLADRYGHAR